MPFCLVTLHVHFLTAMPSFMLVPQSGITNAQLPDWLTNKQTNLDIYVRKIGLILDPKMVIFFIIWEHGERKLEVMLWQFLTAKFIFYRIESKRKPNWCEAKTIAVKFVFPVLRHTWFSPFGIFNVLRTCVLLLLLFFVPYIKLVYRAFFSLLGIFEVPLCTLALVLDMFCVLGPWDLTLSTKLW